jgi:hypothetical protein
MNNQFTNALASSSLLLKYSARSAALARSWAAPSSLLWPRTFASAMPPAKERMIIFSAFNRAVGELSRSGWKDLSPE